MTYANRGAHTCSIITGVIAVILGSIALGGSTGNDLAWSRARVKVAETASVPVDCDLELEFGLISFEKRFENCGDSSSSTSVDYSDTDACKQAFGPGAEVMCNTCRDTGISIGTIESVALVLGIIGLIFILLRICDRSNKDQCKRFLATALFLGVTLGLLISWVSWASTCHQEIRSVVMSLQNTDKLGISLGDTALIGVSAGFSLALIGMFFALAATLIECAVNGSPIPFSEQQKDVDTRKKEDIELHKEGNPIAFSRQHDVELGKEERKTTA